MSDFNNYLNNYYKKKSLLSIIKRDIPKEADSFFSNLLREELNDALEKDNLIKKEDRVLIYKLYQKLKAEFKDIN